MGSMTLLTGSSLSGTVISLSGSGMGVDVVVTSTCIGSGVMIGSSTLFVCECTPIQIAVQRMVVDMSALLIVVPLLCFW